MRLSATFLVLSAVATAQANPAAASREAGIEAKLQSCAARLQQAEADLAAERNRLPELARARREEAARKQRELDAAEREAHEALQDAQSHIHEHTTNCDVVQAQRAGQRVTADALRRHNQALAAARAEVQRRNNELTRLKTERNILRLSTNGQSPEEMEAQRAILRLQQQVPSLRSELMGLQSSLSQARMQGAVQGAVDSLLPRPRDANERDVSSRGTPRRRGEVDRSQSPYGGGSNFDETPIRVPSQPDAPESQRRASVGVGSDPARSVPVRIGAGEFGTVADSYAGSRLEDAARADRADRAAAAARSALSATVDRLISEPSSTLAPTIAGGAWSFAGQASEQARQATERLAAVAGDSSRSPATRWVAGVAGTFTQTFSGETTRQEYGAAAEKVGSYIETVGATAGLAPGGQVASAELSALGAGFSLAGKLMQAEKPLDEAMKLGSAAGLVDVVRHRVKNGYLGAALDGVSVASQLLPGEDQDYVGAAIKVFEGIATLKVDAHFSKELEALKGERAGGRWARGGVYSDMQRLKQQQGLLDTAIGAPTNVKTLTEKASGLLDEITGGGGHGKDPHK